MSVFDANSSTRTELATGLGAHDYGLRNLGALSLGAMTSDTALPPTNGVDCKSVHGRRDQKMDADMNERIDGNLTTSIGQDETHTVTGNLTEAVKGTVYLTVFSGWQEEQQGPVNRHYLSKVTDTFEQDHHVDQPDSTAFTKTQFSNSFVSKEQISIVGDFQLQIAMLLCLTLAPVLDGEYKTLHAEAHILHGDGKLVKLYEYGEDAGATANDSHIKTQTAVRASCNAGVDVDCGFPPT